MAHWGWYWKVKLKHRRKRLCSYLQCIDSFAMFKNKELVEMFRNKVAYEIPDYGLKITLREDHHHVEYEGGSYNIPIEKQSCYFGGFRYFFHCPKCDRRMRLLYFDKGLFLCRKCADLCYYTQILRPPDRCLAMASKIKEKLESRAGNLDRKPPWMKKKTFEALKKKYSEYRDTKYMKAKNKELVELYLELADEVEHWV